MILTDPFTRLPDSARTSVHLEKDATLFRQGDVTAGIFAVRSGDIHLLRHTSEGHRVTIHHAATGSLFAEARLFSQYYHCDATATERSVVDRFEKSAILSLLASDPAFALALTHRLSRDVQVYRRRLQLLSIKSAQERVFAALPGFGQGGTVMTFAAFIGLSHEVTYRTLSALVEQGSVVRTGRGRYAVRAADR